MKDFEFTFSNNFCKTINDHYMTYLTNYALTVLKPECLALNKVEKALHEFEILGYYPVYICLKKLSQNQVFSLWKYGWENADLTRIILNCASMCWNYSAIIILKNKDFICDDSSKRLNNYKESSLNSEKYSIRNNIGSINNYLNFIHVSDNIIEMIREFPILLDLDEAIELINGIQNMPVLLKDQAINIIEPFIGNYSVNSPEKCLKNYIDTLRMQASNNNVIKILEESSVTKSISSELFLKLFIDGKIAWTWNNIQLFTQYTIFKR